jgi:threonine synthase
VAFKLEYQNPTGSFKDRGAAVLLSFLRTRGVTNAVEDSSGNAGAAFAAYAGTAGVKARVFIPDSTSAPKRMQIEKHGAQVVRIMGPRSNASEAVLREAAKGISYASHAYLPQTVAGYATAAYESVEQLGGAPGTILSPVGQGNLLLGMMLGFQALQHAGITNHVPVPVGVQALACAPVWAVQRYGASAMGWVTESPTVAEGVRVRFPVRGDTVLGMLGEFGGEMIAVDEEDILKGRDQLADLGFSVEPTSAIVWQALQEISGKVPDPILVLLTGAGFKSP